MLHILRGHIKLLFTWGFVVAVVIGIISLFFPTYYSATSQVLIISRDRTGADPYTQAKAAEQVGTNLSQVMQTTDFMTKVLQSTTVTFDKARWQNLNERDQRKEWQKDVKVSVVYNTSLLSITAYALTKDDAINFANAVVDTATTHGWEYVGGDVTLKQVDTPLVSRLPARPNLIFNTILGFSIGFILCAVWIVKYKRHTIFG